MTTRSSNSHPRSAFDGYLTGTWWLGAIRVALLLVAASGALIVGDRKTNDLVYLGAFYLFGLINSAYYLIALRRARPQAPLIMWAQVLVDFGVVAATVSFTGGPESLFTFLFVVVILETGVLLGLVQSLIVASVATLVMLVLVLQVANTPVMHDTRGEWMIDQNLFALWYGFLVQTLAYFLTASISGYWNQRIHRMQQFQREILDNMNNGFLIADNKGIVLLVNLAAERILNLKPDEAIGKPVEEVLRVPPGDECPVVTALRLDRDFTRYEYTGLVGPDKTILLGLSTSRMYDWRKRKTGMIVSFSDLTELEKMREELKRQDRLSVVGELAAGLAHEIRNPVAAIRGAVDELPTSLDNPHLATRLADIARRESDQLNAIVTNFLDFARKPRMRREAFDVIGLVDEIVDSIRRKYEGNGALRIDVVSPPTMCPVSGDRTQIRQVFVNLAKNAVEAMDEKGALTVTVTPGQAFVEIRFDDEGPGIEPDKVARIFEPFYTTKESGVGMGLAICLRIVTAHDGTLRASSRAGGGTSMSVRLPVVRSEG
ncbi:MAG: PAS domain S-box protein [Candidatus Hydrogenedentes bacterium]|nr:PAS domain S-box protein [Candidatus Hydrogenedentota bacterium]